MSHTILLVQSKPAQSSRIYHDYNNLPEAMDGLCKLFEGHLKQQNPNAKNITYDIKDLWAYIDALPDFGVLVFSSKLQAYQPYSKQWAKDKVFAHLKRLAGQ